MGTIINKGKINKGKLVSKPLYPFSVEYLVVAGGGGGGGNRGGGGGAGGFRTGTDIAVNPNIEYLVMQVRLYIPLHLLVIFLFVLPR